MNSPVPGEPGIAAEIPGVFPHFFHKPTHTMVTTGKDLFYFFYSVFPSGVVVIMVKPFLSVLSSLPCNKGHNIVTHSPFPPQKVNQCSQPYSFGLLIPLPTETKQVPHMADIKTTNIAVDLKLVHT